MDSGLAGVAPSPRSQCDDVRKLMCLKLDRDLFSVPDGLPSSRAGHAAYGAAGTADDGRRPSCSARVAAHHPPIPRTPDQACPAAAATGACSRSAEAEAGRRYMPHDVGTSRRAGARRSTARTLFGPAPTRQQLDSFFQHAEEQTSKRFCSRWGFDVDREQPVASVRWVWTPVRNDTAARAVLNPCR